MSKADILRVPDYLEHIVEAIERIYRYIEDIDEPAFLQDEKTQDAVIRNFEIIGEAARNVERYHSEFAGRHPQVPWTLMYTLRNRIAHGYFQVDFELIWQSIHQDLPELHRQVRLLLQA
jgi:uncharacterized protein with HEPN domain